MTQDKIARVRKGLHAGAMCAELLIKKGGAAGNTIREEDYPLIITALPLLSEIEAEVKALREERDAYAELAAGKCTTAKVHEVLGQQTLCSSAEYKQLKDRIRALEAEPSEVVVDLVYAHIYEKDGVVGITKRDVNKIIQAWQQQGGGK